MNLTQMSAYLKKIFCFVLICFITFNTSAQTQFTAVSPQLLDSNIQKIEGDNIALYNPSVKSKNKLILMIQGTGGNPEGMRFMDSIFASMGYHVVSIDYNNNVISTICAHSKDSSCSYRFRKEIITGKSLSGKIEVNQPNSLLNRFSTFLNYLAKTDARGKWSQFLKKGQPRWKRIIVAGHSQGAGHAAMLGKMFKVNRVLIFSGPQDYLEDLEEPSPWLSHKSATPQKRYYAFLNLRDPFHVAYQIKNCKKLMRDIYPDTLRVYPRQPVHGKEHILINDIETNDPHGSTLFPEFKQVWGYMLGIKKP